MDCLIPTIIRKRRYQRMVRLMVRMLQQEILNRGKVLAKQIDEKMDERISEFKVTMEAFQSHLENMRSEASVTY